MLGLQLLTSKGGCDVPDRAHQGPERPGTGASVDDVNQLGRQTGQAVRQRTVMPLHSVKACPMPYELADLPPLVCRRVLTGLSADGQITLEDLGS